MNVGAVGVMQRDHQAIFLVALDQQRVDEWFPELLHCSRAGPSTQQEYSLTCGNKMKQKPTWEPDMGAACSNLASILNLFKPL